jgi:hypothetical protein
LRIIYVQQETRCEISGSNGDEYEDDCLMGLCAKFTDGSEMLTACIIRTI